MTGGLAVVTLADVRSRRGSMIGVLVAIRSRQETIAHLDLEPRLDVAPIERLRKP